MKHFKKLSWQLPFLLFLILGTYYTLTQKRNGPTQWQEKGNIGNVSYTISCKGSIQQQRALKAELEKIRQGVELALQNDSTTNLSDDTISSRIYRMIQDFLEKEKLNDYQLEVGGQTTK